MSTFRDILTRLFTRNVVIKRLPGNRLKTLDVNKSQSVGSPTTYSNRARWRNGRSFNSVSGYGSGFTNEEIEALRQQMYMDYELMDTDSIISSALDITSDECLGRNTIIPLLDGRRITIKELYENKESNFWLYGINNSGEFIPVQADKVIFKGRRQCLQLTFDDGTKVNCTPDHDWVVDKNLNLKKSKDLIIGDSIFALKWRLSSEKDQLKPGYAMIQVGNSGKFDYVHRIVSRNISIENFELKEIFKKPVIHHKSLNKINNSPDQLVWMDFREHTLLHCRLNNEIWERRRNNPEEFEKFKNNIGEKNRIRRKNWSDEYRKQYSEQCSIRMKKIVGSLTPEERKVKFGLCGEKNGRWKNGKSTSGSKNGRYYHGYDRIENINLVEAIQILLDGYKSITDNGYNLLQTKYNFPHREEYLKLTKLICNLFGISSIKQLNQKVLQLNSGEIISNLRKFLNEYPDASISKISKFVNLSPFKIKKILQTSGYNSFHDFKNSNNHRIIDIQWIEDDVYDIVNCGDNHLFAIEANDGSKLFTHNCTTVSIDGQLLVIKTDDAQLKKVLHNLFYDILNIEFNLWSWIRTTCKYGDSFLYLQIAEEFGVVNVMPIHPSLMIREEGTSENPDQIRFRYEGDAGFSYSPKSYFEQFEIAHFRLLTDTNFLPYGRSYVEPARKEYKRLLLMEDSMLINRIMRAPERRLFKIDIGNIAPDEVDAYMEQITQEMKKVPYIDPATGDYNLKFNLMPVAGYTKIPLLDGRIITIKELSEEISSGKNNWVYSIDTTDSNSIVPGQVSWCGLTKKNAEIVRIVLDDGSYIDFELDHPVMLRNGTYISAKELNINDSLMPFYTRLTDRKGLKNYEEIYNPKTNSYEVTHRLVASNLNIDNYNNTVNVVHHKNFKKTDNSPENLDCSMTSKEHIQFHKDNAKNMWESRTEEERSEINKKRSDSHKKRFENGAKQWSKGLTKETNETLKSLSVRLLKENNPDRGEKISKALTGRKRPEHSKWMKENFVPYIRTEEHKRKLSESKSGENHPNFGKTWKEIFGEEKSLELKAKFAELGKRTIQYAIAESNTSEQKEKKRNRFIEYNKNRCSNPESREKHCNSMKDRFDEFLFEKMIQFIKEDKTISCSNLISKMNSEPGLYEYYLQLNQGRKKPNEFKIHTIQRAFRNRGFVDYRTFTSAVFEEKILNHKVKEVIFLTELQDVYCMSVEKYHNFAIDSHEGTDRNGIFVKNSSLEDFYMPVRGGDTGTSIETLDGLENAGQKEDVEYFKNKMIAALKIPKEYLGYGDDGGAGGGKANLATVDIRFARTIERLQKIIVSELYKIAIVHLYVQGFKNEDLLNFELYLTNPSLVFERQKTDVLTAKVDLVKSIKEDNLFSDKYIYENIFGMTADEWKAERDEIIESAKHKFRVTQITEEGNDPEVTGKSFGTPWDIATLQMAGKNGVGNSEDMKKLYTPDEREENEGKPPQYKGSFETKRDQDFGRDPSGRRENDKMEVPKPSMESVNRLVKKLDIYRKKDKNILKEDISMLDDVNLLDEIN